ncbi:glycoside hydrolase family 28 protein [Segetibacter sp. 3557_3]|uniref:rhamnogalacturonidase n=1 Tax=Segetibacter sp. 3557_3 TaxID=2547429 RepID=UPI0010586DC1|nr:glycoside hydrolase family 28 protein [Segetibacter sp. 3557_3]TDH24208.1 glycoside hydrolase family 28 protein [Segetibacter sp. 3557_3]
MMFKRPLFVLVIMLSTAVCMAQQPMQLVSIRSYGAVGDGKTNDTRAINDAIAAAGRSGGGTVFFPAGTYISYSIHLQSNISLYLDQGCVLQAADSTHGGRYDEPEPGAGNNFQDFGHSHWHNSLIWGENLENISILGPGTIFGKGLSRGFTRSEGWARRGINAAPYMWDGGANKAIALKLCRNVILKDFTITYGGHFGILATGVDNLTIDNLKMDTNRDGMDIDCCQNVRISNCSINSPYDDAICLKSSYALNEARPTQNVTITNCQVSGYDLGTFINGTYQRKAFNQVPDQEGPTGRIKFGTESNGGFKNITITNCVFDYCRGLALETVDGALLEDVTISNITMRDIVNSPFFLRLGGRMRGPQGMKIGALRRVLISNIMVHNADAHFSSLISGLPGHDIEDVKFNNIRIYHRQIDSPATTIQTTVPEYERAYPEPQKFGVMPAYGFFIRHASNIQMNNIEISYLGKETRPAIILDDVKGIELFNVKAQQAANAKRFVLKNVTNFVADKVQGITPRNMPKLTNTSF